MEDNQNVNSSPDTSTNTNTETKEQRDWELKKYLTLGCLQDINDEDKEKSMQALEINTVIITKTQVGIDVANQAALPSCSPMAQRRVAGERREAAQTIREISSEIMRLDTADPATESREIDLDRQRLEVRVGLTSSISNIVQREVGDMGPAYRRRVNARDFLVDRNQILSSEHKKNVEVGVSLEKQLDKCEEKQSLLDDYANLETQMPSYMDPED